MGSIYGSTSNVSRTPSSEADAYSSTFEHSSSEADGFSVRSGEEINMIFSDPFGDDGVEILKSPSSPSTSMDLRQRRSSSGSRRSSAGSTISSILEDDDEAGYEADSDAHTTSRRAPTLMRRAKSHRARATVHYLVERVEPTIEVLAPITPEELAYLKAHTNIPIPSHYEALLPKNENAGEASELRPSSASLSPSEISLDRIGSGVGCGALPGTTSLPQRFVAEFEHQPQPDLGHSDESHWPACPMTAEGEAAVPSAAILGFEVAGALPATLDYLTSNRNDYIYPMHLWDLPPTPDLRPWMAVASGEPSPMVLASPAVPLFIHAPRPRLTHMASCR
ncbi:hypothetical protein V8D89_001432 [Ganoderma adspersum]